jgi:hypothetical protein
MAWPYQSGTASRVVEAAMAWEEWQTAHRDWDREVLWDLVEAVKAHRAELAIPTNGPRP